MNNFGTLEKGCCCNLSQLLPPIPPGDRGFCLIQKSIIDIPSGDSNENDIVWQRTMPPQLTENLNIPLVSARQIDVLRAKLLGKVGKNPNKHVKPSVKKENKREAMRFMSKAKL